MEHKLLVTRTWKSLSERAPLRSARVAPRRPGRTATAHGPFSLPTSSSPPPESPPCGSPPGLKDGGGGASSHDISPPMVFLLHQLEGKLEGKLGGRETSGAGGRGCGPVGASSAPYPTGSGAPSPVSPPPHLAGGHGVSFHKSGAGASIRCHGFNSWLSNRFLSPTVSWAPPHCL